MRKVILLLAMAVIAGNVAEAKDKKKKKTDNGTQTTLQVNDNTTLSTAAPDKAPAPASTLKPEDMEFTSTTIDFGTVQEGPDATSKFTFVNKGKEPLVIQKAQASCGCTVPSYSKEPVAPGQTGTIDVAFHTLGKPAGAFQKTITVTSNAGAKVLTVKGSVEKTPTTSVPENTSMIKTN